MTARNTAWVERAACAGDDGDVWFDDDPFGALVICRTVCKVREECLAHALDNGIRDGVWGGALPAERQAMKRGGAA